ncbi:MAG: hypothetical protein GOV01_01800 [Candidatus Altiarchaeota archaeon]|nr:hypothetical protein [Candidatus Altiarchaeota archaeon]
MNSLKTALWFSYKPNELGLCGRKDKEILELMKKTEWNQWDSETAEEFIHDLRVYYQYLKSIGSAVNKSPFDEEVISASLIGWDKWNKFGERIGALLKENLKKVAIPTKLEEIANLPKDIPLTHTFHVLYFGAVASDIPRVLGFADRCKVSIGTVHGEKVEYNKLVRELKISNGITKLRSPFIPVKDGDRVFLHHGIVFKIATSQEEKLYQHDFDTVLAETRKFW